MVLPGYTGFLHHVRLTSHDLDSILQDKVTVKFWKNITHILTVLHMYERPCVSFLACDWWTEAAHVVTRFRGNMEPVTFRAARISQHFEYVKHAAEYTRNLSITYFNTYRYFSFIFPKSRAFSKSDFKM